jgi:hypothetical protein
MLRINIHKQAVLLTKQETKIHAINMYQLLLFHLSRLVNLINTDGEINK